MKHTQMTAIQEITIPAMPRLNGPGSKDLLLSRRMKMGMASAHMHCRLKHLVEQTSQRPWLLLEWRWHMHWQ